jgi:hypothetical protein
MKKLCLLLLITSMFAGSVFAVEVTMSADVSCRTDSNNADSNRSDNSKLSIEVDDTEGAKSWIKFDQLDMLAEPNSIRGAILRLALHEAESGDNSFDVSAVNNDYTTNINWAEGDITWNNAPANDTASYSGVLPGAATLMGTINLSDAQVGDQFFVDVSSAVLGDTDGIVQFILHNSTALIQVATHDHSSGEEYWPTLILEYPPLGADFPMPEVGETVTSSLATLSWTNPEPNDINDSISCDVYLGTEPNRPNMDMVSLAADIESASINTTNFPIYGNLTGDPATTYYWYVDCWDNGVLIPGEEWSFTVDDNEAPYNVNAGTDQVTWMTNDPNTVNLVGTAQDDGLPSAGEFTTTWTETAGPETSIIISPDQLSTTVSFVEPGDYEFTLTADDGLLQTTDTVRIVVGADACDASHISTGAPYNDADANQDCLVDLQDFIELIVDDWLECTDTLTNCAI